MDSTSLMAVFICLASLLNEVDSRLCKYMNADGLSGYFSCSSFEYCCGRGCCRSTTLTFYQLWYFWLSVILILLLCSGGGWWYRFKYRGHVFTQASDGPNAYAFYYPQADRIMLQNIYKDNRCPQASYRVTSPYSMPPSQPPYQSEVPTTIVNLPPSGVGAAAYPTYPAAPPSYNSIFGSGKETPLPQVQH